MKLLLFDIDGTLLEVTGGVHAAVSHAVSTVTGRPVSTDGVSFAGRTDPAIFRDVLDTSGVAAPDTVLQDVIQHYVERAQHTIGPDEVDHLPGVHNLLDRLASRDDVQLGLLTGNVEAMARHKLQRIGLDSYFPFGAFGSDHANRDKLPSLALRRAASYTGHSFAPDHTIIIGDTPHDIRCARAAGTRVAAVCTGGSPRADLHPHTPDLLLDSFSPPTEAAKRLLTI